MDDFEFYLRLVGLLTYAAGVTVINADGLSIGPHPYEDLRDEGELAVLDVDQNGSPILAQLDDAAPLIIERCGQVRTIGAILTAVENSPGEYDVLADIVTGARCLEQNTPGGPADLLLRLVLAARAVALDALGMPGEIEDKLSKRRGTGVLGLDGYDFRDYERIGMLPLTTPDRAAMQERAAAA